MIAENELAFLKCAFCWKRRATHIINDAETLQEINICEACYNGIYGGDDEI